MATTTLRAGVATHDPGELLTPADTRRALRLAFGVVILAGILTAAATYLGSAGGAPPDDGVAQVSD